MAVSDLAVIMGRIAVATPASPIAVFLEGNRLRAVFAATVTSRREIAARRQSFVGLFDRTCSEKETHLALSAALVRAGA